MARQTDRRHAQGEASRRTILDATLRIAGERGYVGTTLAQVTKASGLPASSVYWHFRNKDELLADALEHGFRMWDDATPPWSRFDPARPRVEALTEELGDLRGCRVLVLGLTYRHGVKELAYSRALPLVQLLRDRGAEVLAWDPLLEPDEIERWATSWTWGDEAPVQAIVTQTADPRWEQLDAAWFPELRVVVDGRNSLRGLSLGEDVRVRAFGVPARGAR
jgi:AcrR family transcriptional regulator